MSINRDKADGAFVTFFVLGLAFIGIGISTDNPGFFGAAIAFIAVGIGGLARSRSKAKSGRETG